MRTLIAVALLLTSGAANAADGNLLHDSCKAKRDGEIIAYIAGWIDKRNDDVANFERATKDAPDVDPLRFLKNAIGGNICFPAKLNPQQTRDILCQYLEKNPQDRHLRGATLVWDALNKAWPCPK